MLWMGDNLSWRLRERLGTSHKLEIQKKSKDVQVASLWRM